MPTDLTLIKRRKVLNKLALGASPQEACAHAGITTKTFRRWRREDTDFRQDSDEAIEDGTDRFEDIARRRAIKGSDQLLMFILKARRPEKYRDNTSIHHSGGVDVSGAANRLREKLSAQIKSKREARPPRGDG